MLSTLLIGVYIARVFATDQSGSREFARDEERRLEVPEVVLQLKYDRGELNKIYLTQFRKDAGRWVPSVPAQNSLCSDLCYAGLGGEVCGLSCAQLVPVGLHAALKDHNTSEPQYGHPRYTVCPALCDNHLGEPLCNCARSETEQDIDWSAVCSAFCLDDYTPSGCPTCENSDSVGHIAHMAPVTRVLSTTEGWTAWCNVQCMQGQGGAACNCDRAPFQ